MSNYTYKILTQPCVRSLISDAYTHLAGYNSNVDICMYVGTFEMIDFGEWTCRQFFSLFSQWCNRLAFDWRVYICTHICTVDFSYKVHNCSWMLTEVDWMIIIIRILFNTCQLFVKDVHGIWIRCMSRFGIAKLGAYVHWNDKWQP
jgi:hypothetical protein